MVTFSELNEIKPHFGIKADVELGNSSYFRYIKHSIVAFQEGLPVTVQIGELIGGDHNIDEAVAKRADELLDTLEHIQSEYEFAAVELVIMEMGNNYRVHVTTEDDCESFDNVDLEKIKELDFESCCQGE